MLHPGSTAKASTGGSPGRRSLGSRSTSSRGWRRSRSGQAPARSCSRLAEPLHEAITPDFAEEERVRRQCASLGVDSSAVTFRIGPSHEVLPGWEPRPLDLVLIDGAHGFPYPDPRLVAARATPSRRRHGPPRRRLPSRRGRRCRLRPRQPGMGARRRRQLPHCPRQEAPRGAATVRRGLPRGARPHELRYLPPGRRAVASTRQRVFSTRAGLWLVRTLRKSQSGGQA